MGLVLEEYEPLLCHRSVTVIHLNRYYNRAGINLIRYLHILKLTCHLKLLHTHKGYIHETYILIISALVHLFHGIKVALIGCLDRFSVITVCEGYILKLCREGGMTTVI